MESAAAATCENPSARVDEETSNWVELPPDLVSTIFLKLGPIEVLLRTQWVCKTWQKLSKQPNLYHHVDMRHENLGFESGKRDTLNMAKEAIDRSSGEMVEFAVEHFASGDLLRYIRAKCSSLKCIRLYQCEKVGSEKLIKLAKTLNQLEELEISLCEGFSTIVLETFGQSCPQLKSFRLNSFCDRCPDCNSDALAIAKSMPGLHHLSLLGSNISREGVVAILDGCPHLKTIELRKCSPKNMPGLDHYDLVGTRHSFDGLRAHRDCFPLVRSMLTRKLSQVQAGPKRNINWKEVPNYNSYSVNYHKNPSRYRLVSDDTDWSEWYASCSFPATRKPLPAEKGGKDKTKRK